MSPLTSIRPVAWSEAKGGVRLKVRLTPKSARDALEGCVLMADGTAVMRARVRAVPEDGKANAALVRLIGKELDTAPSAIAIEAGATSRVKTLFVSGDAAGLARRLDEIGARFEPAAEG
jgi:uncharacterized protein YggU (UPF0235/DUF167 family)